MAQRLGNDKVLHLRLQALWVQEVRCTTRFGYKKGIGSRNAADIQIKHVPKDFLYTHRTTIGGGVPRGARQDSAHPLASVVAYIEEWYVDSV